MIITLTLNPCIDLNLEVDAFSYDQPLRALAERRRPGGKGINVSAVLEILGMPSTAVVPLGGVGGAEFEALARERIRFDLRVVPVAGNTRTNIVVTARRDGRQIKINQRGAAVSEGELAAVLEAVAAMAGAGDAIVLAGSLPPGAPDGIYAKWTEAFRSRGCFVALDADHGALREGVQARPDLIKPNREELERLAGRDLDSEASLLGFARDLVLEHGGICFVSNGPAPAYLLCGNLRFKGWPPEAHGSPVGAGDACLAGMLWGLLQGMELRARDIALSADTLREAFRTALACGAASASTPDTEYFGLDLFRRCRDNVRVEED